MKAVIAEVHEGISAFISLVGEIVCAMRTFLSKLKAKD